MVTKNSLKKLLFIQRFSAAILLYKNELFYIISQISFAGYSTFFREVWI